MTDRRLASVEVEADIVGVSRALAGVLVEADLGPILTSRQLAGLEIEVDATGVRRAIAGLVAEADVAPPFDGSYACIEQSVYGALESSTYGQLELCSTAPRLQTVLAQQAQSVSLIKTGIYGVSVQQAQACSLSVQVIPVGGIKPVQVFSMCRPRHTQFPVPARTSGFAVRPRAVVFHARWS